MLGSSSLSIEVSRGDIVMGDAKRRRRAHSAILAGSPECIYCTAPADTIEHMPPIAVFLNRDRPKGLEFPCCDACNQATKHSDLVAAMLSRIYPNTPDLYNGDETSRLIRSIRTNVPGLLEEMDIKRGGQKLAAKELGIDLSAGGGFLRMNGPLATKHMTIFAAKLGYALFYECHSHPVPPEGALRPIYYSNVQALTGGLPGDLLSILPTESKTLRAGKKHVGEQFDYVWRTEPAEGVTVLFATFRMSFAAGAIVYHDRALLDASETFDDLPFFVRRASAISPT